MTKSIEPKTVDLDKLAMDVFLKSLEIAGGPRKLIEHRNLTWVPSLIESSYAVVMFEEQKKTAEEIAEFLGIGSQTVKNILKADPEAVEKKLKDIVEENSKIQTHIAGGLSKLAYKKLKSDQN